MEGTYSRLAGNLARSTLREQVAESLKDMIVRGDWQVGEFLPSQSELSDTFSVSVPVIREALQILNGQGLVNVIHGKGAVITPPNASCALTILKLLAERQMLTVTDLWEVRFLLEPEIAALAAQRASSEQIQQLHEIVAPTLGDGELDVEEWVRADIDFHTILAEATGNSLLPLIMGLLTDLFAESLRLILTRKRTTAPSEHLGIIAAIADRDSAAARLAMRVQLNKNRQDIAELESAVSK